ncbi:hypothetical protein BDV96DRAFT_649859 [Lophiotrema nucula]|uniref:Uncharacterized protein n=1 Tax=Lophiotrema nucula TaxID=690887 RepID=A0A6A5Z0M3_9PLEO|nr:hypothetical protein BDV96DRAFT_649859 [Lophiotrema nucula]
MSLNKLQAELQRMKDGNTAKHALLETLGEIVDGMKELCTQEDQQAGSVENLVREASIIKSPLPPKKASLKDFIENEIQAQRDAIQRVYESFQGLADADFERTKLQSETWKQEGFSLIAYSKRVHAIQQDLAKSGVDNENLVHRLQNECGVVIEWVTKYTGKLEARNKEVEKRHQYLCSMASDLVRSHEERIAAMEHFAKEQGIELDLS